MSMSAVGTRQRSSASSATQDSSLLGQLEGHQIRRIALATAVLSWAGLLFLIV